MQLPANVPFGYIAFPPAYWYRPTYDFPGKVGFDWFTYVFPTFAAIGVGAANQQQLIIQNDSDFECRRIVFHMDLAAAAYTTSTQPMPNVTALIVDSGSGRQLMSAAVPLASIATLEGQPPVDLPWPKIFIRNSTISLTLTNFDAAVATANFRVSLQGRKIFPLD